MSDSDSSPAPLRSPEPEDASISSSSHTLSEVQFEYLRSLTVTGIGANEDQSMRRAALNLMEDAISARSSAKRADEQRRQAEIAWQASERQLRQTEKELGQVQRIAGVGGVDIDVASGLSARRSPEYIRLHGLDPGTIEETHEDWLQRVHPDDRDRAEQTLQEALHGNGHGYEGEYRIIRPVDGEVRWIFAKADIERDENGKAIRLFGGHIDITERKRAEIALRESESKLAAFFAKAEVGISEIGSDGRFRRVNDTLCRILGRSREELLQLGVHDVTHPDDLPETLTKVGRLLENGEPVSVDKRYCRPDGTVVFANSALSRLETNSGNSHSILAITADLTARKAAEDALRDSREHLQLVLESVRGYAIITMDSSRLITGWNRGAETIFGYKPQEILGKSADLIFTPEDRSAGVPEQEIQTALTHGRAPDERWHLRKNGERFWVSGMLCPFLDQGKSRGFVKVAKDLTEQRNAETALRESEARFRTLSDAVAQIMWTNDANGGANYFNRRWYEYTGATTDRSLGDYWQTSVHPEDAPALASRWSEALASGTTFEMDYRLRGRDGGYRWFIGRNVPLLDSTGSVIGWYGTATDIELIKQAEAELKRAHDELEDRVSERTRELSGALDRLRVESEDREKLQEDRRELLIKLVSLQEEERARISRELHDNLSQHMVAVKFGLDALETSLEEGEAPELDDIQHLRKVVETLIKAAHRQAWELRPAELDHLGLQVAIETYLTDWSDRVGIPVDFNVVGLEGRLPPDLEIVFYRITQEALANVARHSQATEVVVRLEAETPQAVTLTITDNGKGFNPSVSRGRLGILGMRERMSLIGGTFDLSSTPGRTSIIASLRQ